MWDRNKAIKILRYYSLFAVLMSVFFVMCINEYFPPVSSAASPGLKYLEAKKISTSDTEEKEKIEALISNQKIIMLYDKHVSDVKDNIMILSSIFLIASILIFIDSSRELKKDSQ